jgi:hypothetical protein
MTEANSKISILNIFNAKTSTIPEYITPLTDYQIMGGFRPVFMDSEEHANKKPQFLNRLKVESIFERLKKIATNNLVAVSEMPLLVVPKEEHLVSESYKSDKITYDKKNYNPAKLNILNVHFSGDGPNQDIKNEFQEGIIFTFLKEELGKISDITQAPPDVICGDTNITIEKSSKDSIFKSNALLEQAKATATATAKAAAEAAAEEAKAKTTKAAEAAKAAKAQAVEAQAALEIDKRNALGKKIVESLKSIYVGTNWLVIMSNIKVGKYRRGFFIVNQQIKKSVPYNDNEKTDFDGTLIAINLKNKIDETILNKLNENSLISLYVSYPDKEQSKEQSADLYVNSQDENLKKEYPTKNALQFEKNIEDCVDINFTPTEKIFLDHSVLHINYELLCNLVGKEVSSDDTAPQNLIVINMGSIRNAGIKNWRSHLIDKWDDITKIDKELFDAILEKININKGTEKIDMEYNQIDGVKLKSVTIPPDLSNSFKPLLKKALNKLKNLKDGININVHIAKAELDKLTQLAPEPTESAEDPPAPEPPAPAPAATTEGELEVDTIPLAGAAGAASSVVSGAATSADSSIGKGLSLGGGRNTRKLKRRNRISRRRQNSKRRISRRRRRRRRNISRSRKLFN